MKFVINGSTGNISKTLSEKLIEAGYDVTVVTSSEEKIRDIEALGATALVGFVEDASFNNRISRCGCSLHDDSAKDGFD